MAFSSTMGISLKRDWNPFPYLVYHRLQLLPYLEEWKLLWRDIDNLPCLRIPTSMASVISQHETPESPDLNPFPSL